MRLRSLCFVTLIAGLILTEPTSYAVCQAGCEATVAACYNNAIFVLTQNFGAAMSPNVHACYAAFESCQWLCSLLKTIAGN